MPLYELRLSSFEPIRYLAPDDQAADDVARYLLGQLLPGVQLGERVKVDVEEERPT